MSDKTKIMECPRHGDGHATFVCQHLVHGSDLGFYHGDPGYDLRPDAWCGKCDVALMKENWEWNDRSEKNVGITPVCHKCYDEIKERNTTGNENL